MTLFQCYKDVKAFISWSKFDFLGRCDKKLFGDMHVMGLQIESCHTTEMMITFTDSDNNNMMLQLLLNNNEPLIRNQ